MTRIAGIPAGRNGFRLLEHTADIGLEIWAESLELFFEEAFKGLRKILFGPIEEKPENTRKISVTGGEPGELLVNWLNEFLFLWETENWVPLEVHVLESTPESVKAQAGGIPFDSERHGIEREVKAATYHQLEVKKTRGEWRGRIFLDL